MLITICAIAYYLLGLGWFVALLQDDVKLPEDRVTRVAGLILLLVVAVWVWLPLTIVRLGQGVYAVILKCY